MDILTVVLFFALGINFFLSFAVAALASSKGRSFVGYLILSWITSFFIGLIVVALLPRLNSEPPVALATCEFCGENVLAMAKVCKHCTRDIVPNEQLQLAFELSKIEAKKRKSVTAMTAGAALVFIGCTVPGAGFWIFFGLVAIGLGIFKYAEAKQQAVPFLAKSSSPDGQAND